MYYTRNNTPAPPITIRPAHPGEGKALRRLAQLDSAELPRGELLVALMGEELVAAVSIERGEAIADPFRPSAGLVKLLSARAAQLRGARRPGPLSRLRRHGRRASSLASQPAGTLRALD